MNELNSLQQVLPFHSQEIQALQLREKSLEVQIQTVLHRIEASIGTCSVQAGLIHREGTMNSIQLESINLRGKAEGLVGRTRNIEEPILKAQRTFDSISETIQNVEDILELKRSSENLKAAVEQKDYETAGFIIQKFTQLESVINIDEGAKSFFHETRDYLQRELLQNFKSACEEGEEKKVNELLLLLGPLNLAHNSMSTFVHFIGKGLQKEAQKIDFLLAGSTQSNDITEQGKVNPLFTQLFGRMLSLLLKTFKAEKEKVNESFGDMKGFVDLLFYEMQPLTSKILQRLQSSFVKNATTMKTPQTFIEEFVTIINYYQSFMGQLQDSLGLEESEMNFLRMHDFSKDVLELINLYLELQKSYMNAQFQEEGFTNNPLEAIDSIFFVIHQSLMRGLTSLNLPAAGSIVNFSNQILSDKLSKTLDQVWMKIFEKKFINFKEVPALTSKKNKANQKVGLLLNALQQSMENIAKLQLEGKKQAESIFGKDVKGSMKQFQTLEVTLNLLEDVHHQLSQSLEDKLNKLVEFLAKGIKYFNQLKSLNLNITIEESDIELVSHFQTNAVRSIGSDLRQWTELLFLPVKVEFFPLFCEQLSESLIRNILLNPQISLLGAIQLDKFVRAIVNFCQTQVKGKPLRSAFSGIFELVALLNLQNEEELKHFELVNQKGRFGGKERKEILLKQRSDLDEEFKRALL